MMRNVLIRLSTLGSLIALSTAAGAQAPAAQPPAAQPAQPPAAQPPAAQPPAAQPPPAQPAPAAPAEAPPAGADPAAPPPPEPSPAPPPAYPETAPAPLQTEPALAEPADREDWRGEKEGDGDKKKKKKKKKDRWEDTDIEVDGFLHARYLWHNADAEPSHSFRMRNARLRLNWEQGDLFDAQIEAEFADEEQSISAWAPLRDAYVRVKPLDALRFRAGQFKKPVSGLELTSRSTLALVERGLSNDWLVEELRYGDRDVGVQVEGRFGDVPRLNYAVGVFNGTGLNREETDLNGSKDIAARVDADVVYGINVGVNVSHKRFDQGVVAEGYPPGATLGGADFTLEIERATIYGEGMYGMNYLSRDNADSWSLLLLGAYRIPLTEQWGIALEPLAKGEILKVEDHIIDGHVWTATAGANLHVGSNFRLMVQGETQRAARNALPEWQDENRLFVQAALRAR